MFLGYKVNSKGLKVCPDKVDAVLSLPSPKCLKDVQKLNGKLASLNRFLAKSAEKSLPFFKTLKKCTKKSDFHWTTEAEEAFKQMKQLIAELPMLTAPMEKEELIVYLAATKETVHPIIVITDQPIQQILSKPEVAGRLQKWSIKLGEYTIHYRPRVSVKGQILADFIVERPEEDSPDTLMEEKEELPKPWILFTDGSSCTDGSGAGLILTNPKGMEFTYTLRFRFDATNNEAEYEALIAGLRIAEQIEKYISEVEVLTVVEKEGDTWMTPIHKYPAEETLLADMKKARAIRRKSWRFAVINGILYKKSFLGPWLRYTIRRGQGGRLLLAYHAQRRKSVNKSMPNCQVHKPIPRNPQQKLTPITSPWPFYKWGIDIAGPFPEGPEKVKFLIVAMDYFTKWIEAKPVATITGNQIKKFIWDNIVCRFRLLGEIISDNGKQFRDDPFKDWCEKLYINQHFAFVKHPQTNGLVERANRILGEGIKARLEARSKNWMEELPHVPWAHRTMIKSSNGDTPFSLTYGTEAVIPAETGMPTIRTAEVDLVQNNEALEINLDLLEERREEATIREAKSKAKMEKYYNAKVRNTSFKPGDFVYRNNDASRAEDTGKLGPKWEGPYKVMEALGKGAYKLRDRNGKQLLRTWNISNLNKCYVYKM
ncbi:reverse transcriptase domain-containing protein [Tanacetum coccineum]